MCGYLSHVHLLSIQPCVLHYLPAKAPNRRILSPEVTAKLPDGREVTLVKVEGLKAQSHREMQDGDATTATLATAQLAIKLAPPKPKSSSRDFALQGLVVLHVPGPMDRAQM